MISKFNPDDWQALSPHLDVALEMTEGERSLWLASLQAENPALANQIEHLLREHRELSEKGFLESGGLKLPGGAGLEGQKLGAYTLVSQIGHGGMGTVWMAKRNDGRFERRVAVKVLNFALLGKAGEERFKREGQILARLRHPHIAELIDAGVSMAGQPYLVLEYIEGDHIDRYCDQRSLDVRSRILVFLDALRAVAQAHAHLIVHRDLKPSNILVRTDGQAKLLDFGIAKLLVGDGQAAASPLTLEGGRAMTPEFAAPEQLKGEPVTAATDVYASGVLLFLLLTGQHPCGTGPRSQANIVKAILENDAPRPSEVVATTADDSEKIANAARRATTPDKLCRLLRGDLDTIVAKALKKNLQERYSSVKKLADDLHRYLRHEPISARADTILYRIGKFSRRHRGSITAAILALVALTGTSLIAWFFPRGPEHLPQFNQRKLTASAQDLPVLSAAISPDGRYLGFADQQGIHLQLVATNAIQSLHLPSSIRAGSAAWAFGSWFPDSTRFIATASVPGIAASVWAISVIGNEPQKLAEIEDISGGGTISPGGSQIAFERLRSGTGNRELWVMGSGGESPHKILTAETEARISGIAWSPLGNRIAYRYRREQGNRTEIAIESCDLSGGNSATILQDTHLSAFTWTANGRFIYSRNTEAGSAQSDNLWELQVDANTGTPRGKARQLTDWSGFSVSGFSATSDAKQLAFLRANDHATVFVGDLAGKESRLTNFRRLTADDNYNLPSAWTPDSNEVVFSSERTQNRWMYRQALDYDSVPQLLTPVANTNFYLARLSPDGAWILLEGEPVGSHELGIYRVSPAGGVPERIFDTRGFVLFSCTNKTANLCVFGRPSASKSELVIAGFDPLTGPGKELLRIPLEAGSSADVGFDYWWQISPDGSMIGIVKRHGAEIRLVPLRGGSTKTITVNGYPDLIDFNWGMDSHCMLVSTVRPDGPSLLRVDLTGVVKPLWHQSQANYAWGYPSPDGRHLAIMRSSTESNVWVINNF
ncbi:MAG TPA: protein kinase [Candidatus Acidoferrum sp.]|nr:protein kinase [Candidatus Acidoferrum sp.]